MRQGAVRLDLFLHLVAAQPLSVPDQAAHSAFSSRVFAGGTGRRRDRARGAAPAAGTRRLASHADRLRTCVKLGNDEWCMLERRKCPAWRSSIRLRA
eukprot:3941728-Rhodomonas_salina.3